jgi:hypothetical protein
MTLEEILTNYDRDQRDEIATAVGVFTAIAEQISAGEVNANVEKTGEAAKIAAKYPEIFADYRTLYDLIMIAITDDTTNGLLQ